MASKRLFEGETLFLEGIAASAELCFTGIVLACSDAFFFATVVRPSFGRPCLNYEPRFLAACADR